LIIFDGNILFSNFSEFWNSKICGGLLGDCGFNKNAWGTPVCDEGVWITKIGATENYFGKLDVFPVDWPLVYCGLSNSWEKIYVGWRF